MAGEEVETHKKMEAKMMTIVAAAIYVGMVMEEVKAEVVT